MAASLLLRATLPLFRNRFLLSTTTTTTTTVRLLPSSSSFNRPSFFTTTTITSPTPTPTPTPAPTEEKEEKTPKKFISSGFESRNRKDSPDYRQWKDNETEILKDIEPIIYLTKDILHSDRYIDGESLTVEDEKAVIEKLLTYHPHSQDKIGCGLDSIMVDRHPQFNDSRCLFVVRTDGGWIDFSYQKCLRAYIKNKYPSYAERFIREHFKRKS